MDDLDFIQLFVLTRHSNAKIPACGVWKNWWYHIGDFCEKCQIKIPKKYGLQENIVVNFKSFLFIEVRVLSLSSVTIYQIKHI